MEQDLTQGNNFEKHGRLKITAHKVGMVLVWQLNLQIQRANY